MLIELQITLIPPGLVYRQVVLSCISKQNFKHFLTFRASFKQKHLLFNTSLCSFFKKQNKADNNDQNERFKTFVAFFPVMQIIPFIHKMSIFFESIPLHLESITRMHVNHCCHSCGCAFLKSQIPQNFIYTLFFLILCDLKNIVWLYIFNGSLFKILQSY